LPSTSQQAELKLEGAHKLTVNETPREKPYGLSCS